MVIGEVIEHFGVLNILAGVSSAITTMTTETIKATTTVAAAKVTISARAVRW